MRPDEPPEEEPDEDEELLEELELLEDEELELLDEHRFGNGVVHLHYRTRS